MKKKYLLFLTFLVPICFWGQVTTTETFETATSKATSFTSNGQVFTITSQSNGPFSIDATYPGTGWSGTANDNRYIDNDGVVVANTPCGFTIGKTTPFNVNSFYLFLSGPNLNIGASGTLTVVGKLAGSTVFTATKTSPFNNTSFSVNNGYTLIDMTTFGGANNSTASIDELVITTTSGWQYVGLDAFKWTTTTNTAPTNIALSASSINENVSANSVVGALSTTDANTGDTFTYTLVSGTGSTDNASFTISGSSLKITNSPDFETKSSYSIRVRTTDSGGLFTEKQFTVTINDLNETPTDVALSATAINENVTANSTVGILTTTDQDGSNTFTYSLVSGTGSADNAAFSISTNSLKIVASPDFETKSSYAIRLRTTDQGGLFFEKQFTITINNLNESPTDIALSATAINENVAANSTVGTLSSTDPDASNTFTYTLVTGTGSTDNASFNISGTNLRITNSPDFETKSSYAIRIRTTDQGSLFFEKQFTITINNVNETVPSILSISDDTGDSTSDFITKDNTLTINGTAEAGSIITMSINGSAVPSSFATATTNGAGVYSIAFPTAFPYSATISDGNYNIIITSTLNSVALSSATKVITVDTAASILITTPIAGDNVIDNVEAINLTLSGTSSNIEVGRGVTITISDGTNPSVIVTSTITTGGAWTKTGINISSLKNGSVTITAAVTDLAGNNATVQETGATLNKLTLITTDFNTSKTTIVVYPNPVSSILTVVNSENSAVESIEVITSNGQVVATAKNTTTIDVSNLVSGVYFVRIKSGNTSEIKKIVKE